MKNILLTISIAASVIGLQACNSQSSIAECPTATAGVWASSSYDIGPIIEGYGAVHETYITLERRGPGGVDSSACQMTRIYCPKPHDDKGCQTYRCEYAEAAGAVVKAKDYQGTRFFAPPPASQVVWDGQTLRCGPA